MSVTRKESILPVSNPMVTLYAAHANALSVLESRPGTVPWLLNRFVQTVCWQKAWVDYLDFNFRDCPMLNYQRIDKTFIALKWDNDIAAFAKNAIDSGYYVSFLVKTRFIPAYIHGGDHLHELFVYGYDDDAREFYIADNFDYGRYQFKKCTYEELDEGYSHTSAQDERKFYGAPQAKGAIQLISFSGADAPAFDPGLFAESLEDYLLGTMPTSGFNLFDYKPHAYGCSAVYQVAIGNIREIIDKPDAFFDIRRFQILWEHKSVMLTRLGYMAEQRMMEDARIVERYRDLERKLHRARGMILKYFFTQDKSILEEAAAFYQTLLNMDLECSNDLLHRLKAGS
ncbi:hypothetical protein ACFPPD_09700 [Cohnella suwonensis]|uniref:Butirosin biosynthesis protein H N-terminal domain-containing protein n=1 Tax=Cohnella suwonensis TaxID=696072 RepID=A0ABW0LWA3_9BACL